MHKYVTLKAKTSLQLIILPYKTRKSPTNSNSSSRKSSIVSNGGASGQSIKGQNNPIRPKRLKRLKRQKKARKGKKG